MRLTRRRFNRPKGVEIELIILMLRDRAPSAQLT
jgi:hypothetical protein